MRLLCTLSLLLFASSSFGQQRIGFDFNSRLTNANFTVQYHRVIKGPLLFTTGISGGYFGPAGNFSDSAQVVNGFHQNSYPTLTNSFSRNGGNYQLRGTGTKGTGIGAFVGVGVFKEFANFHGFRLNVNHHFLWGRSHISAYYRDYNQERGNTWRTANVWHPLGAVSIELYHTMRLNGRFTFYWGGKLPYYYSMDKARFNPKVDGELFHKFLPDISIGITRAVGKCD